MTRRKFRIYFLALLTLLVSCTTQQKKEPEKNQPQKKEKKEKAKKNLLQSITGFYRVVKPRKRDRFKVPPKTTAIPIDSKGRPYKPQKDKNGQILSEDTAGVILFTPQRRVETIVFDPTLRTAPPKTKTVEIKDKTGKGVGQATLPESFGFKNSEQVAQPDTTLAINYSNATTKSDVEINLKVGETKIPLYDFIQFVDSVTNSVTSHYAPTKVISTLLLYQALQAGKKIFVEFVTKDGNVTRTSIRTPLLVGLKFTKEEVYEGEWNGMSLVTGGCKSGDKILIYDIKVSNGAFSGKSVPSFPSKSSQSKRLPRYQLSSKGANEMPCGSIKSGVEGYVKVRLRGRIVPTEQSYNPNPVLEQQLLSNIAVFVTDDDEGMSIWEMVKYLFNEGVGINDAYEAFNKYQNGDYKGAALSLAQAIPIGPGKAFKILKYLEIPLKKMGLYKLFKNALKKQGKLPSKPKTPKKPKVPKKPKKNKPKKEKKKKKDEESSSAKLGKNLIFNGETPQKIVRETKETEDIGRKKGYSFDDAHHIVKGGSVQPWDKKSRGILKKFGIKINSANNGAWLRAKLHKHIHTNQYSKNIYNALKGKKTKAQVLATLKKLKSNVKKLHSNYKKLTTWKQKEKYAEEKLKEAINKGFPEKFPRSLNVK